MRAVRARSSYGRWNRRHPERSPESLGASTTPHRMRPSADRGMHSRSLQRSRCRMRTSADNRPSLAGTPCRRLRAATGVRLPRLCRRRHRRTRSHRRRPNPLRYPSRRSDFRPARRLLKCDRRRDRRQPTNLVPEKDRRSRAAARTLPVPPRRTYLATSASLPNRRPTDGPSRARRDLRPPAGPQRPRSSLRRTSRPQHRTLSRPSLPMRFRNHRLRRRYRA